MVYHEFTEGRTDVNDEQRSGRPSLISYELLQEIEGEIYANRHVTLRELHRIIPEMSKTTIHETVTEELGYRKLCARWVPKMLTDDHKMKRMGSALKFLTRYAQEDEFLDSIVTGDEKWVFHTLLNPSKSLQWRHTHSPRSKKFKTSISVKKKSKRPFSGTEKAFSWSTSCLLAQQLMPLHIVIP